MKNKTRRNFIKTVSKGLILLPLVSCEKLLMFPSTYLTGSLTGSYTGSNSGPFNYHQHTGSIKVSGSL